MLRKVVLWFLILPLPLNGLWMACNDVSSEGQGTTDEAPALTQEQLDCIRICAMKHQAIDGPICIILPGDSNASITIINFGVAVLQAKVELAPITTIEEYATELPVMYSGPNVFRDIPPPRV